MVLIKTAETGENATSLSLLAVVDEPTRRKRHEDHTDTEKNSGGKLESERKKPCSLFLSSSSAANVVGTVVDPETDHDTQGDAQLLETDKRTTHFRRRNLGIVHGYNHRE